jgi:hypothetical protein
MGKIEIFLLQDLFQFGPEEFFVEQVSDLYSSPGNLVFIARSNPSSRGSDLGLSLLGLPTVIYGLMVGMIKWARSLR